MESDTASLAVSVSDEDHFRGRLDAPIVLVEYADFECPYCADAYPIVKALERTYGDKLCVVFREFPLPQHPHALQAAETAEFAADAGAFWPMHDMLFEHQRALDPTHLTGYAEQLGLDAAALRSALRARTYVPRIEDEIEGGEESGVSGTPTFFVNGVLFTGEPGVAEFSEVFDGVLRAVR